MRNPASGLSGFAGGNDFAGRQILGIRAFEFGSEANFKVKTFSVSRSVTICLASMSLPIKSGNDTIGAIGVSGTPTGEKDEACGQAGIDRIADRLK